MSTLKVDTYLTRGGASEIAIDKLKGASSAGSMTVVAEGGTNTTNLQQGLCKAWINFTGVSTTAARDSFNISGLTDEATAQSTMTITSNMNNANYTGSYYQNGNTGTSRSEFNNHYTGGFGDRATATFGVYSYIGTSAGDVTINDVLIFGDLA